MQQLLIIGNVGKEAVVRQAANGQAIGFSVAVNESYKDKQTGERKDKTTWYKATFWKKLGESTRIAEYLKPGQAVSIIGRPYADAYVKDGNAIGEQCVRVERLELIGSPKAQNGAAAATEGHDDDRIYNRPEDDDNDLPF